MTHLDTRPVTRSVGVVTTREQLKEVAEAYSTTDEFVFDVETWGEHRGIPVINDVLWIALATYGRTDVIPLGHPHGEFVRHEMSLTPAGQRRQEQGLSLRKVDYSKSLTTAATVWTPAPEQLFPGDVFSELRPVFFSDAVKVGHNVKFDVKSIAKYYGEVPPAPYADTMVASFLLDNRTNHKLGLDDCLARDLGYHMEKGVGEEVEKYAFSVVARYAYLDATYTWLLWRDLRTRIETERLTKLFALEMDVTEALCHMELTGALMDVQELRDLKVTLERDLDQVVGDIYREAGLVFNINSNAEKLRLLFTGKRVGGRGLKPKVLTPGGKVKRRAGQELTPADYSVSEEALRLHEGDPLVDKLLHYADLKKMVSTYVVPYVGGDVERTTAGKTKTVNKKALLINGRVYGDFDQIGTETGRFSSRNPNMQNIPNPRTELGRRIRNLWIAGDGYSLVVADYSQIEPRVIASLSGDPTMIDAYLTGEDIYTVIGNSMGVDRTAGKVLVLSIAYGVGEDNIAHQIGCTIPEAKKLLESFGRRFHSIDTYRREVIRTARAKTPTPFVETILRRRRYLPELANRIEGIRRRAERQAFNTKIQGSAADIIKIAMVRAHRLLPPEARMILTVHDEIVTMTPTSAADATAAAVREAMENIHVLQVPLIADVKVVDKWGAAK